MKHLRPTQEHGTLPLFDKTFTAVPVLAELTETREIATGTIEESEARESTNTKLKRSVEQVASEPRGGGETTLGRILRDEGIQQVSEHNEPWVDRCRRSAELFLSTYGDNEVFTGETVRFWCRLEVGEPSHPNGWGALINSLVKRKLIVATGQYVQPKDKTSHARAIQVYKKA